ncbi:MAG: hypothetical protein EP343_11540 [Deltaproteobacteria bacterium]|nr:MAG: hypothetical protein EP343_11540 [Deltaproteobacteria bacterium]
MKKAFQSVVAVVIFAGVSGAVVKGSLAKKPIAQSVHFKKKLGSGQYANMQATYDKPNYGIQVRGFFRNHRVGGLCASTYLYVLHKKTKVVLDAHKIPQICFDGTVTNGEKGITRTIGKNGLYFYRISNPANRALWARQARIEIVVRREKNKRGILERLFSTWSLFCKRAKKLPENYNPCK